MFHDSANTNARLLELFKQGDEQAISSIYRRYYKALVFFAFEILRDQSQAEDCTQEGFIKLWQHRNKLNSLPELVSYLYVCVKNAGLNILQRNGIRNKVFRNMQATNSVDHQDYIETRMLYAQLMSAMYEELQHLPPQYRDVLQMLYVEELPATDAAHRLQISPENLRIRKFRAIHLLRSTMLKKGFSGTMLLIVFS